MTRARTRHQLATTATAVATTIASVLLAAAPAHADSGSLDTSFGTNGVIAVPTPTGTSDIADSVKLPDGSRVVVGTTGAVGARDVLLAKFTPSGALDTSFSGDGVATFDAGGADDAGAAIAIRTAGGFWVGGTGEDAGNAQGFVAAVDANGALVNAFDTDGIAYPTMTIASPVRDVAEAAGGKIAYIFEDFTIGPPNSFAYMHVLDATGAPDATFNLANGNVPLGVWALGTEANPPVNIQVLSTGKYLVTGYERDPGTSHIVTARVPADGDIAAEDGVYGPPGTFGVVRQPNTTPGSLDVVNDATLLPGDQLELLAGTTASGSGDKRQGMVLRLGNDGALVPSFGTGGRVVFDAGSQDWTLRSTHQTTGGLRYFTGDFGANQVRTVRTTSTYALDPNWGTNGVTDRTYGSTSADATTIFTDSSDRPIILGAIDSIAASYRLELFDYAASNTGTITSSPDLKQRLQPTTFTFTVTNPGPDRSSTITTDIDYPSSFEDAAYSSTNGGSAVPVGDGSGATWTVPNLNAGETATLTLTGKPGDIGTMTVSSVVTAQANPRPAGSPAPVQQSLSVTVFGAGTPRDDVIVGTPLVDVIDALAGNDKVTALGSDDVVYGREGNDELDGGEGNDTLDAGPGDDTVIGGPGNDTIAMGEGTGVVDAGPGNDGVTAGSGTDKITTGDGNDNVNAGDGDNTVDTGTGNDGVATGSGDDKVTTGDGNDTAAVGDGNNVVDTAAGNDSVTAGAGNDRVTTGEGNDTASVGDGNNTVETGAGDDKVTAGDGNDRIATGSGDGDDAVAAGGGNNSVDTGDGDDRVTGGGGNDAVTAGGGHNVVAVGDGDNVVTSGGGNDKVTTGNGDDKVNVAGGNDVVAAGNGTNTVAGGDGDDDLKGGSGVDVFSGSAGNDRLRTGGGNDRLYGGLGRDILIAGGGDDRLQGDDGDDALAGYGGNDLLLGGPGRDRLGGGDGNDRLYGGAGSDWMNGGAGNDLLQGGSGNDWMRGFLGDDVIDSGFGNDLINAGASADRVSAGKGNDIIRADDGQGGDHIDCGTGWDLVYVNPGDTWSSNCEFVKLDLPAGTPRSRPRD